MTQKIWRGPCARLLLLLVKHLAYHVMSGISMESWSNDIDFQANNYHPTLCIIRIIVITAAVDEPGSNVDDFRATSVLTTTIGAIIMARIHTVQCGTFSFRSPVLQLTQLIAGMFWFKNLLMYPSSWGGRSWQFPETLLFVSSILIPYLIAYNTERVLTVFYAKPLLVSLHFLDPPAPTVACSLFPSTKIASTFEVSFEWSPSFNSQHTVLRYNVSVSPDPAACSSDQISPNQDFRCVDLVPHTIYNFTVSAIVNCEEEEGETTSFLVQPQGTKK